MSGLTIAIVLSQVWRPTSVDRTLQPRNGSTARCLPRTATQTVSFCEILLALLSETNCHLNFVRDCVCYPICQHLSANRRTRSTLVSKVEEMKDVEDRAQGELSAMKSRHAGEVLTLIADNNRLKRDNGGSSTSQAMWSLHIFHHFSQQEHHSLCIRRHSWLTCIFHVSLSIISPSSLLRGLAAGIAAARGGFSGARTNAAAPSGPAAAGEARGHREGGSPAVIPSLGCPPRSAYPAA